MVWQLEQFLQERVELGRRLMAESEDHRGSTDLQVRCSLRCSCVLAPAWATA